MLKTIILLAAIALNGSDEAPDTLRQSPFGYSLSLTPARQIAIDKYTTRWLKDKQTFTVGAELTYTPQPESHDDFARDYGYPTLAVGLKYDFNHGTTMHREPSPTWPLLQEVDYDSHLGNAISLYGSFSRPFVRFRKWHLDYVFRTGLSYTSHVYNSTDNIDDEFIGSHVNIYFGAAVMANVQLAPHWALQAGIDYRHHSNGATHRPNKGENAIGPTVGIAYTPLYKGQYASTPKLQGSSFNPYWYLNFTAGIGAKCLDEDWQTTQFRISPEDPDYRTDQFHVYAVYTAQADVMCRYARRWASGIGFDIQYGTYADRLSLYDAAKRDIDEPHSPWSVGVAAKHEVFWHDISLAMALGCYVHRKVGPYTRIVETPYYERIGLHYHFPHLGGLTVGANVKAHKTKADLTEIVMAMPINLKK